ncbi:MAG: hypothetical protein K6G58_09085 [Lachnospiraceae bacterium]|nr:hypothetical protein [Lachnospiraceae bacterium]
MSVEEMFEKLESVDEEWQLKEIKLWLFKESVRLRDEKFDLEMQKRDFANDRENAREENRRYEEHLAHRSEQLRREEELIEQKHAVIKRGFEELDRDRQALNAREISLKEREAKLEERIAGSVSLESREVNDVLFRGADNILLIKKRYKDLLKMFHPDCLGGDTEMVKSLNRTYDRLIRECDSYGKRRRA